jgi:hypothetical protein
MFGDALKNGSEPITKDFGEFSRLLKNSPLPTSGPRFGFKNACFEALKPD